MLKRLKWTQWIALFIFVSMGVSFFYTLFEVFTAPVKQPASGPSVTLRSDYLFLLLEIILGMVILALPSILARRFNLRFRVSFISYL